MCRILKFLQIWQNFWFLHICHELKSEISPHDQFFLHLYSGDIGDKYELYVSEDWDQRLILITIKDQEVGRIHRPERTSIHEICQIYSGNGALLYGSMGLYWDRLNIIQLQARPGISCCLLIQPPPPDDFLQHTFGFENTLWSLLRSFVWKNHCWFSRLMLGSFYIWQKYK